MIVEAVVGAVGGIGPLAILAALCVLTSALTEMVSNNAVAVLIGPIVIALAIELGFDPLPFIMAVMFAVSASFATPIGYQTNTFVYVAGRYKFIDFIKVGLPLNVIFAVVAVLVIPLFSYSDPDFGQIERTAAGAILSMSRRSARWRQQQVASLSISKGASGRPAGCARSETTAANSIDEKPQSRCDRTRILHATSGARRFRQRMKLRGRRAGHASQTS